MTLEVVKELFLGDATKPMRLIPYHRWGIIYDPFDGEVAHNLADWLTCIDINLIHIRVLEYPFTVFIQLATIEDCLAEDWSYG